MLARGVGGGATEVTVNETVADLGVINIAEFPYGASPGGDPGDNHQAIMDALDTAQGNGGGVIYVPGTAVSIYGFDQQIVIPEASNVVLWAPGGAQWMPTEEIPVPLAIGDYESLDINEENFLAVDAASGDMTIELDPGKGASFVPGETYLMRSTAVIPEHHVAVTQNTAEYITIAPDGVTGDVLTLSRPLRYSYAVADNSEVYRPPWIRGFKILGLGFNGNDQIDMSLAICLSWCFEAHVEGVTVRDVLQRGLRLQGTFGCLVDRYRQSNGRSLGFQGEAENHFSYATSQGGPCEADRFVNMHIDRCRHAFTTVGTSGNDGLSSAINDFGVPMDTLIADSIHTNARGAGFDTHESGTDITFSNCHTVGGLTVGFQLRSVRAKLINGCSARDCMGAAVQLGTDAQYPYVETKTFSFARCNLGLDGADPTFDWRDYSPFTINSVTARLDGPHHNLVDNGSFDIWDRGSTFSGDGGVANRWNFHKGTDGSATVTRQNLNFGTLGPLGGTHYLRLEQTNAGSDPCEINQYMDVLRDTANRRVVVSFWARSTVEPSDLEITLTQFFGTGGMPSADVVVGTQTRVMDDTFKRMHCVFDVPTLSGKTPGSNLDDALILTFSVPVSNGDVITVDLSDVQLEISDTMSEYAVLPIAETRDRCGRWYEKSPRDTIDPGSASESGAVLLCGALADENLYRANVNFCTRKRREPTVTIYSTDTGASGKVFNATQDGDIDAQQIFISPVGFTAGIASSGAVVAQDVVYFTWEASVANFA